MMVAGGWREGGMGSYGNSYRVRDERAPEVTVVSAAQP